MSALTAELSVEPLVFPCSAEVRLAGRVRNTGDVTVDPGIVGSQLLIDGHPSRNWPLAVGNGLMPENAFALAAGDYLEIRRDLPANALFAMAGRYELRLSIGGVLSDPVWVDCE